MTGWIIALSVAALLGLLLLCPVRVFASFQEEWKVTVRCLFFHIQLLPEKPKKRKRKVKKESDSPKKEEKQGESSKIRAIIKEKGLKGFIDFILRLGKEAAGWVRRLMRPLVIQDCTLTVIAGGEDAAQTAIEYGSLCAVVYTAAGAVLSNVKCKRHNIRVLCDFQASDTLIRFEGKFSIRLVFFLTAVTASLFRFFKAETRNQKRGLQQISE